MRTRSALLILACCGVLPGQNSETYESFFGQVAQLGRGGNTVRLNGQPSNLVSPRLQDEIGLTVEEADQLSAIASDFRSKWSATEEALRSATWEERMAAIAGEAPPRAEGERMAQITRQQAQLVADQVEQLKTRLGAVRFKVVQNFINSRKGSQFFPPRPGDAPRAR